MQVQINIIKNYLKNIIIISFKVIKIIIQDNDADFFLFLETHIAESYAAWTVMDSS